jgi:hypothetical protein
MTELKIALTRAEQLGKKDEKISIGITTGIGILLALLGVIWLATMGTLPAIEEPEWKTIGLLADFGNGVEGSSNVNNFEDPSPTPAHAPHNVSHDAAAQTSASQPVRSDAGQTVTQDHTETVAAPPVRNDPKPNTTPSTNTSPSPRPGSSTTGPPGGSNHGNGTAIGNAGDPRATVLNDDGRFQFGDGIGGGGGRKPLKLDLPSYSVQQEAKIKFTIIIEPSGDVVYAKAEPTPYTELANIGKDAILKWRFNEVDESAGNLRTTVTIKFRLQ